MAGALFVLVFNAFYIWRYAVPTIMHDEFGYWMSAAYFNGKCWDGISSGISYYSYGTGIILGIFMKIFSNSVVAYRAVLVLNLALETTGYMIAYTISKEIFHGLNPLSYMLMSVLAVSYPTYIMNTHLTWSECYLTFFIWLNIYLFIQILRKPTVIKMAGYAGNLFFLYAIHQRSITILAVGIVGTGYLFFTHRIKWKALIIFLVVVVILSVGHVSVKGAVKQNVWKIDEQTEQEEMPNDMNDYSGRIKVLLYALSHGGISSLLHSLVGKLYYAAMASLGIVFPAFYFIFSKIEVFVRKKEKIERNNLAVLYIGMIFILLLILCCLANMEDGLSTLRMDSLIYGRYFECSMGAVLLLGTGCLFQEQMSQRFILLMMAVMSFLSIQVYSIYINGKFDGFIGSCAGGIYYFYLKEKNYTFVFSAGLTVITVFVMFMMLMRMKEECWHNLAIYVLIVIFCFNGKFLDKEMFHIQTNNQRILELADKIEFLDFKAPIYCVRGSGKYTYMYLEVLQYLLADYNTEYISMEDIKDIEGECYLLLESYQEIDLNQYVVIGKNSVGWHLLVKKDGSIHEQYLLGKERVH